MKQNINEEMELKCPLCAFRPREYKNDDPETAKTRLHGHFFVKHSKGELIQAIFILAGWDKKKDWDIWPRLKMLDTKLGEL